MNLKWFTILPKERDVSQHECSFAGHRRQLSCSSFWAGKIRYWSCAHPRGISANSPLSWPLSLRMHRLPLLLNLLTHAKILVMQSSQPKTAANVHMDWTLKDLKPDVWQEKQSHVQSRNGCKTAVVWRWRKESKWSMKCPDACGCRLGYKARIRLKK